MDAPRSKNDGEQAASATLEPRALAASLEASASAPARTSAWDKAKPTLLFVASFTLLNLMMNVRYPQEEPALWYLLPSVDIVVVLFYFAVFGWNKWRIPAAVRGLLVAFVFLVRLIRFGDGVQKRYYFQAFNLYGDLPQIPNLVRLAYSTFPLWKFSLVAISTVVSVVVLVVATYRAFAYAEQYLADMRNVWRAGISIGVAFVVFSLFSHDRYFADFYYAGFAASSVPRLKHEASFLFNIYGYNAEKKQLIARAQERLAHEPGDLGRLHHANVYLILVESYGVATFDQPYLEEKSRAVFDAFESEVGAQGFSIVSGLLDSPTHGGQSWLAHATLGTTVQTADQLQYELVSTQAPKTMARFFRDAGYRTVLVQPGTTREWKRGEFYQFEYKYYAWNFDYAGPKFAWATMPDQYVLDFVRRNEIEKQKGPLFVQYALVSSHAPWSDIPVMVEDWSKLGDGALYNGLESTHFPITWPDFDNAADGYVTSIIYDMRVLKSYISEFVRDDSLVILLGDHQPVREVSGGDENHAVPVHVISRDPRLIEPFLARGYVRGMRPRIDDQHPPMAEFLINFLEDFSLTKPNAAPKVDSPR
jgi:hypothetical protein